MAKRRNHGLMAAFLAAYGQCGCLTQAARAAGIGRRSHYDWLQRDPEYREAFDTAQNAAVDALIFEARKRALEGSPEIVLYQGRPCYELLPTGKKRQIVVKRKSDALLMFLIKGMRPEIYRDSWRGQLRHTGIIERGPDLSNLTDSQLHQLEEIARAAAGDGHDNTEDNGAVSCTNG